MIGNREIIYFTHKFILKMGLHHFGFVDFITVYAVAVRWNGD